MELNPFLESLLDLGGTTLSDLHFKAGSPPLLRIQGTLESSGLNTLGPEDTSEIATALAGAGTSTASTSSTSRTPSLARPGSA